MNASTSLLQRRIGRNAPAAASAAFVVAVIAIAAATNNPRAAVYALSGWHYLLYFLAYFYGAVPLAMFRRDAIAMKAVALAAFGVAYFAAPLDWRSIAVIAAGFLLNISAASALGADRTYYGFELAGLAPKRIEAFPYSLTAHPMLIGNMVAFAGTLLNEPFRRDWWPLAAAHVALNLGALWMETRVPPRRRGTRIVAPDRVAPRCGPLAGSLVVAAGTAIGFAASKAHPAPRWAAASPCTRACCTSSTPHRRGKRDLPVDKPEGDWT